MHVTAHIAELPLAHPRLLWSDITLAAVAVFGDLKQKAPFRIDLSVSEVPGFGDDVISMFLETGGIPKAHVRRLRRTYEPARLVELAAIAVAGLGLYHTGGHIIHDVALRGTGADYLVDEQNHLLEIAGRSRRSDLESAWQQKWQRLSEIAGSGFYVCVAEFETPTGRLAFKE